MADRHTYFFKGLAYERYDIDTDAVDVPMGPIAVVWSMLPLAFQLGVDTAVNWGNRKAYFFKGSDYVRYDIASNTVDVGPSSIAANWTGMPVGFQTDLDAAASWGNGHAYFFKGTDYVRFNIDDNKVDHGPESIAIGWAELPAMFQSDLGSVVNMGDGWAYFFKGDQYLLYDMTLSQPVGTPEYISSFFPTLNLVMQTDLDAVFTWNLVDRWHEVDTDFRFAYAMDRLIERYSLPLNGAAGLLGNVYPESGVIPARVEGSAPSTPTRSKDFNLVDTTFTPDEIMNRDSSTKVGPGKPGVGLAQWTWPSIRRAGLFTHSFGWMSLGATMPLVLGSAILFNMDAQLDYMVAELQTKYAAVWTVLTNPVVSVDDACDEVTYRFEVPQSVLDASQQLLPKTDPQVVATFTARRPNAHRAVAAYNTVLL
jgi:Hemopexin.